ncbi:hypothetical protein IHE31_10660 [Mycetohabitans rhizoxinica]|uniref:hypothetical protein n=1 Tax=Mycetohabitans rhizoxinica TaxID=412963 RepID=UPI0030CE94BE
MATIFVASLILTVVCCCQYAILHSDPDNGGAGIGSAFKDLTERCRFNGVQISLEKQGVVRKVKMALLHFV